MGLFAHSGRAKLILVSAGRGNFPEKTYEFTPDSHGTLYQKWGDFSANFWFTARIGKTPRRTCANAVMRLRALCSWPVIKCYYEYEPEPEAKCE